MKTIDEISAQDVHSIIKKHMIGDGFNLVLDFEKSHGTRLHDAKHGTEYLDFFTFFASNPLGLNHPKLTDDEPFKKKILGPALNKPSNSDVYTREMADFMEIFDRIGIPEYLPHCFFISGGALAVENALKVAFDWKVQKNFQKGYRKEVGHKILHLDKAFHGRTGYTMSLTNTDPVKTRYFPQFDWPRITNPSVRYPLNEENIEKTIEHEERALAQARKYFKIYRDEIAAIILEPIQGEGGDNHFRLEFHRALRDLADEHEALFIYDEVQTGVGLTGSFWAHEHFVKPDILAFGKKAQVCGILAGKRVDEVEKNCFNVSSRINSTWGGNLVDMVRFGRILEIIEEENLVDNAKKTGEHLLKGIREIAQEFDYINNARGKGLFCAFDLPDTHSRDAVVDACFQRGLLILPCGEKTIRFRPPLTIKTDDIDQGLDIIEQSIRSAMQQCPAISK